MGDCCSTQSATSPTSNNDDMIVDESEYKTDESVEATRLTQMLMPLFNAESNLQIVAPTNISFATYAAVFNVRLQRIARSYGLFFKLRADKGIELTLRPDMESVAGASTSGQIWAA